MRTTIRLPDELYKRVRVTAATEGVTVTSFIEGAVRELLARHEHPPSRTTYRVTPFHGDGLQPGVDLDDNTALLELMNLDARG